MRIMRAHGQVARTRIIVHHWPARSVDVVHPPTWFYYQHQSRPPVTALNAICKTFVAERDVINAVFEDNARQGLKPSAQTKSDHTYFLWLSYPGRTHKEIGLKVGLIFGFLKGVPCLLVSQILVLFFKLFSEGPLA